MICIEGSLVFSEIPRVPFLNWRRLPQGLAGRIPQSVPATIHIAHQYRLTQAPGSHQTIGRVGGYKLSMVK